MIYRMWYTLWIKLKVQKIGKGIKITDIIFYYSSKGLVKSSH